MRSQQPVLRLVAVALSSLAFTACQLSASELDSYGGDTSIQGSKTGFFHVEEIDGRNWFITPEGNAFFAVALSTCYLAKVIWHAKKSTAATVKHGSKTRLKKREPWDSTVRWEAPPAPSEI